MGDSRARDVWDVLGVESLGAPVETRTKHVNINEDL